MNTPTGAVTWSGKVALPITRSKVRVVASELITAALRMTW